MAKIYGCGWEMNTVSVAYDTPFVITTGGAAAIAISSSIKNQISGVGGKYSARISNSGAAGRCDYFVQWRATADGSSNGPFFFRFYLRVDAAPSTDGKIIALLPTPGAGGNERGSIRLNSSGALELWDNNSQVGSDSSAIAADSTFHPVEMKFQNNGANMTLEGKLDGSVFATGTTTDSVGGIGSLNFGMFDSTTGYDLYFDDFMIDDAAYCGAGVQIMLRPNGAGDANNFSGGTGVTYAEFDEEVPDDLTSYSTLATNNDTAFFTIDDPASQGMGPGDVVNVVMVGYRWKAASADTCSITGRIKSQVSGTIASGSNVQTATTSKFYSSYGADPSTQAEKYYAIFATDPQAGGAWTRTLLQTAQIGVIAPDAAPDVVVSTLWALVDFVPATRDLTGMVTTLDEDGSVDVNIPSNFPTDADSYGIVSRTCTTTPLTVGAAGTTNTVLTGSGTQSTSVSTIPGCSVSVTPYYVVGSTTVYGSTTTTSGTTPATASDTRGCAMLGGII